MKLIAQAILMSALLILSGCAISNITVFHRLPETPVPTKYAFIPLEGQNGSLEYDSYKGLIRSELKKYQYEEVSMDDASVVVAFNYEIGSGKEKVASVPVYGKTGVSSSRTYGTLHTYGSYGSYSGTTTYTPTYGITGYQAVSRTEYMRKVWLHIVDKESLNIDKPRVLYEANVTSEGSSSQIATVMPAIIRSIFKKFPGKSGSTRKEMVPIK